MHTEIRILTSLDKVFEQEAPQETVTEFQGLQNERISFQFAFRLEEKGWEEAEVLVDSPIFSCIRIREAKQVPVHFPMYGDGDADCLRTESGLYPDLLDELNPHCIHASDRWTSLWFDIEPDETITCGTYPVAVTLKGAEGEELGRRTVQIEILPALLPKQKLIHTKWFHTDGLAQYYHTEAFSEKHWEIIENYIRCAVRGGINMILMPVHTPPLDTRPGGERLTTQLVDIYKENGHYRFGMEKVRRWIRLCKDCQVEYYEIAHLFTQWGGKHAPKIMAWVNGSYQKIFGWETDSTGEEYGAFLREYIPALRSVFREEGIDDRTYWHISDEPSEDNLEDYLHEREQVDDVLKGCTIMDTLSSFEFYQKGVVPKPVVANSHIQPFLDAEVKGLWTYYCCGQYKKVSNMFIAMPSYRNRILAVQLYKYRIEGFLQWGFNFYNSRYSDYPINPFLTTDADGWVPAGDPFQVYPGEDGKPLESIRMAVTQEAMQDLRAMEELETLAGREFVLNLIDEGLETPVTFEDYPRNKEYILNLRRKINKEIAERTEIQGQS